ncbi:tRNA 4-thiouridine(8) synthase ThiI [Candidatus Woesearchaeota archaeon]|nr:tRNA 4-thiouridine(8) synthase ThiI [Candidatus Woesearchaeota archaeon]
MIKAVGLFSGGLDSLLAIKLIQKQGIDVIAVAFRSPFFIANQEKKKKLEKTAKTHKFKIKFIELGTDYLNMVKKPKHGHGKNMNPCIDCHAFMLKKAKAYAKKIKAKFIFTGEVLNERPMSQNRGSLNIVEKEAGLKGKLLRPLSAKLLKETEAEKKAYVDRNKLLGLNGRSRKPQFALAKKFKIKKFETPGGGCVLTYEAYSNKLRDLFKHKKIPSLEDAKLLKTGRHFRKGKNKIIVGRNHEENKILAKQKGLKFEAKGVMGPTTLLTGKPTKKAIELAASLTARYSDAEEDKVAVKYNNKEIIVNKIKEEKIKKIRI